MVPCKGAPVVLCKCSRKVKQAAPTSAKCVARLGNRVWLSSVNNGVNNNFYYQVFHQNMPGLFIDNITCIFHIINKYLSVQP